MLYTGYINDRNGGYWSDLSDRSLFSNTDNFNMKSTET